MSDSTYAQGIEQGDYQDAKDIADPVALMKKRNSRILTFRKLVIATGVELADAMASTATAETRGFRFPYAGIVTNIKLTPHAAITGHATDAFTMTVSKRDAAGANLTTLGTITSLTSGAGSFVAFVGENFTLTNANLEVVAGGYCTWSIAKNGSGVVVPTFDCDVTILDQ